MSGNRPVTPPDAATMDAMPQPPAHAKPSRHDHLWVLGIIAAFALFDVWGAWAQVGDKSGFAVGHTGTGWTLTVIVEAAAGYFLFAWFSAPGKRSRRFAMCSAFATLALSLIGQGASTFAAKAQPPVWLTVFIKDLPVVVLALIAVLIHMRRLDREDADDAEAKRAEGERAAAAEAAASDERTALRAQLETARADVAAAVSDRESLRDELTGALETAHADLAEALARAEKLAQKLAAVMESKRRQVKDPKGRKNAQAEGISLQLKAANLMDEKPHLRAPRMGGVLARELGVSSATGTRLHKLLTAEDSPGESLSEESGNPSGDRSENQS